LGLLLQQSTRWYTDSLLSLLGEKGYRDLREPHLNLLANLECGSTYASAVAAQMGLSRQAIYRTTRELQDMGFLALQEDEQRRNQKVIVMTTPGMTLVNDARAALASIETTLATRVGAQDFATLRRALEAGWGEVLGTDPRP
jgi:DNA-binding MarR family transcriptional regulator